MYIAQPQRYQALVTPFAQRLLQYGVDDSKIYLSEAANAVFRSFTNGFLPEETDREYDSRKHAIIDGGYVETSLDGTSLIKIKLKKSTFIADLTLLIFPEDTTVDLDVATLDPAGELLVFLNFQYRQSVYENKPFIKVLYYDGTTFTPDNFEQSKDSIILTRIKFEKSGGVVTKIESSVEEPYSQTTKQFMNINGDDFEIAPLPSLWYRMIKGYHQIHSRRQEFTLDDISDWVLEVPNFDIGSVGTFYSAMLNINIVNRKLCNVQCYIANLKIDPTAIQHIDNNYVKIWMPEFWVTQPILPIMSVIVTG